MNVLRERSLFMAGKGGGQKFHDLLSGGGGGGGDFFLAYFLGGRFFLRVIFANFFFRESDITCIITVVGAQKQHKGMFF